MGRPVPRASSAHQLAQVRLVHLKLNGSAGIYAFPPGLFRSLLKSGAGCCRAWMMC